MMQFKNKVKILGAKAVDFKTDDGRPLMGQTYTIELPYQPVCDALTFFKPAVLAVGAITSAFIVAGINVKGED